MLARRMIVGMILAVLVLMSGAAFGTTYYVDPSGDDNNSGTSWSEAFATIQKGIDTTSGGDVVEVNEGTYYENLDFGGKALTVTSTELNDWDVVEATIIDANGNGDGVTFDSGEDANSVLTGFTVTNGSAGVYVDDGSPVIERCILRGNDNGAEFGRESEGPLITNCIIKNNSDYGVYGELGDGDVKNSMLWSNGRGIKFFNGSGEVRNNTIANNTSCGIEKAGGAGQITISNCIIWNNTDDLDGCSPTYSCISDSEDVGDANVTHNISENPNFAGNYRIYSDSPCVDAGDPNGSYGGELDIDGDGRVLDGDDDSTATVDMGADEVAVKVHNTTADEWYVYVQYAISQADPCDEILVYPGIYEEHINFNGKAIIVRGTDPNDWDVVEATVIDGGGTGTVAMFSSGEGSDSILEGVTVKNGTRGMYISGSSPTISKCVISENSSSSSSTADGIGVYCVSSSSPTFEDCIIRDNVFSGSANSKGGGVYCSGSEPIFRKTVISNNDNNPKYYFHHGGGMYCTSSDVTFDSCVISKNRTSLKGGGVGCSASSVAFNNCIISQNGGGGGTYGGGAGIYASDSSVTLENCVISQNGGGGGIYCTNGASSTLENCTVAANGGGTFFGGGIHCTGDSEVTVGNCILWGNVSSFAIGDQIYIGGAPGSAGTVTVSYSDVEGGEDLVYDGNGTLNWQAGNIDEVPLFIFDKFDQAYDYNHVDVNSPCIDAGDPNGSYEGQKDIDGAERVHGGRVDIGADETPVIWYVDANATGAGTGYSWEDAFTTIQAGIDAATGDAVNTDKIVVAVGRYYERIDFEGKAITVRSVDPNDWDVVANTVIDANDVGYVVSFDSGEGPSSILAGVTVTNAAYSGILFYTSASDGDGTVVNCIIADNPSGGIECYASPTIINNKIYSNPLWGIGCYGAKTPVIKNNWIWGATYNGGGWYGSGIVFQEADGGGMVRNNTVVGNERGIWSYDGVAPSISNCIVWNNNDSDLVGCSATYSCIEGCDDANGTGNICGDGNDPEFIDDANDDYRIGTYSPCIDAGDPNSDYSGEADIDNGPRVQSSCVDMGGDEADPNISVEPNSLSIILLEGNTGSKTLTIDNSGGVELEFNIWPSNNEALGMMGEKSAGIVGGGTGGLKDRIVLEYDFKESVITRQDGYDRISIEGLENYEQVGAPIVPMRGVKVLIPYGKRVINTKVEVLEARDLPGTYYLAPGQQAYPVSYQGEIAPTEPDAAIYGSNRPWPGSYKSESIAQSKRGYQLFFVNLYPVQYSPKSGIVSYASKLQLVLKLGDEARGKRGFPKGTRKLKSLLSKKFDNAAALSTYPSGAELRVMTEGGGGLPGGGPYEYVIITNEDLKGASGPWNFKRLRDSKIARGISSTIVTTEYIYANYEGNRPDGGEDNQTRIRNFLTEAYNEWGTEYVLLGGPNDVIPARKLYCWVPYDSGTEANIPCDIYYGCVEPNECTFDYDADGLYGEPNDGVGGDEVDLVAEIYVGRAAVESGSEVSDFVRKTLMYNSTISTYLPRVSSVGQVVSGFSKEDLEPIRLKFRDHNQSDFYEFDTLENLYEAHYIWDVDELIELMNGGTHVFNHFSHSGNQSMGKFNITHIPQLTNNDYFFIHSGGCFSGKFDTDDCFAEEITVDEDGALAVIMNSRYGWTGHGPAFIRRFWDAVLGDRIMELGAANHLSKENNVLPISVPYNRWLYYTLNLFGDPEQQFLFGQDRDSAWVEAATDEGTVGDHNSTDITVNFNAESLPEGTYEGEITIMSNDPVNESVAVPVTMTVVNLVSHWKYDEGSGTTAYDSRGYSDGTLVNGPNWTSGQIDGALEFYGDDEYVDCESSFSSVTGRTRKSITAWVKADDPNSGARLITLYKSSSGASGFALRFSGSPATWSGLYFTTGGFYEWLYSGVEVDTGAWTHIALVQDGTDVDIYINGVSRNSASNAGAPILSNPPNAIVGAYVYQSVSGCLDGKIDDVRVYKRALSDEEVEELYEEGSG